MCLTHQLKGVRFSMKYQFNYEAFERLSQDQDQLYSKKKKKPKKTYGARHNSEGLIRDSKFGSKKFGQIY